MNDNLKTSIDVDATSASILLPNNIKFNITTSNLMATSTLEESNDIVVTEEGDITTISAITHDNQFIINVESDESEIKIENEKLVSILKDGELAAYIEIPVLYDTSNETALNYQANVVDNAIVLTLNEETAEVMAEIRIAQAYAKTQIFIDKINDVEYWYDMSDKAIFKTTDISKGKELYFTMPEGYTSLYSYTVPRMISETRLLYCKDYENVKEYDISNGSLQEIEEYDCDLVVKISKEYWIGIKNNYDYASGLVENFCTIYKLMKYNGTSFDILDEYKLTPKTTSLPTVYYLVPSVAMEDDSKIILSLIKSMASSYFNNTTFLSLVVDKESNAFTTEGMIPGKSIVYKDDITEIIVDMYNKTTTINGEEIPSFALSNGGSQTFLVVANNEKYLVGTSYEIFNTASSSSYYWNKTLGYSSPASYSPIPGRNSFCLNPIYKSMSTPNGYYSWFKVKAAREIKEINKSMIINNTFQGVYDDFLEFPYETGGSFELKIAGTPKDVRLIGDLFNFNYTDPGYITATVGEDSYYPGQKISSNSLYNIKITNAPNRGDYFYYSTHLLLLEPSDADTVYINNSFDLSRRISKTLSKTSDSNRRTSLLKMFNHDSLRKIDSKMSVLSDTSRKVEKIDRSVIRIDTNRRICVPYSATFDAEKKVIKDFFKRSRTNRQVVEPVTSINDLKRSSYKDYKEQSDLNRVVALPAITIVSTERKTSRNVKHKFDTNRKLDKFFNIESALDTLRRVTNRASYKADTQRDVERVARDIARIDTNRQVIANSAANSDLTRRIAKEVEKINSTVREIVHQLDIYAKTERQVMKLMTIEVDSKRQVVNSIDIDLDAVRQAYVDIETEATTKREVTNSAERLSETVREIVKEAVVRAKADTKRIVYKKAETNIDMFRNVSKSYISIVDAQREVIKTVELNDALERKVMKELIAYSDTYRDVDANVEDIRATLDIELELNKGSFRIIKQEFYKSVEIEVGEE